MKQLLAHPAVQDAIAELIVVIMGLIVAASPLLSRWFRAKGLEITESQQRLLDTVVANAAAYAEEWALSQVKRGATPVGREKLDVALVAAKELARNKLTAWTDQQLRTAIESKLPELRAKTSSTPPSAPTGN